jgi:hypothetical protein
VRTNIYEKEEFALRRCTERDGTTERNSHCHRLLLKNRSWPAGTVEESIRRTTFGITDLSGKQVAEKGGCFGDNI